MLEVAAKQKITPWVTKRPLEDVNKAVPDMHAVSSVLSLALPPISYADERAPCSPFPQIGQGSLYVFLSLLLGMISSLLADRTSTYADRYVLVNTKNGGKL